MMKKSLLATAAAVALLAAPNLASTEGMKAEPKGSGAQTEMKAQDKVEDKAKANVKADVKAGDKSKADIKAEDKSKAQPSAAQNDKSAPATRRETTGQAQPGAQPKSQGAQAPAAKEAPKAQ